MHKRPDEPNKRIGKLGLQLAALGIAMSVFAASTVLGADVLDKTAVYDLSSDPYAGITQEGELGIAQLSSLEESFEELLSSEESGEESEESAESEKESSAASSKEESSKKESAKEESSKRESSKEESSKKESSKESSKPSSKPSSRPSSSSAVSSKPASSKPVSSKPSSKEESSKKESSKESSTVSSEPVSSKPVSSEASRPSSEESKVDPEEQMIQIIAGAVQCEIIGPGSTPQSRYYEAYKAQAVACRSYMEYYKRNYGYYPTMSYNKPHAKTVELVREVCNKVVTYNGAVINAVYHADAGGKTQSSQYVWGSKLGYLKAVDSPNDVVTGTFTISAEDCAEKLRKIGIEAEGDPETWFDLSSATYTDGDFVYELNVCGQKVKARTLREQVFGTGKLQSTKILSISVSDGKISFKTKGYGHGVGLSQRGALGCSAAGWSYTKILKHYYTGVSIATI